MRSSAPSGQGVEIGRGSHLLYPLLVALLLAALLAGCSSSPTPARERTSPSPTASPQTSPPQTAPPGGGLGPEMEQLAKEIRLRRPNGDIFLPSRLPPGWLVLRPPIPVYGEGETFPDLNENPTFDENGTGGRVSYSVVLQGPSGGQTWLTVDGVDRPDFGAGESTAIFLEGNEWRRQPLEGLQLAVRVDTESLGDRAYEIVLWGQGQDPLELARIFVRIPR